MIQNDPELEKLVNEYCKVFNISKTDFYREIIMNKIGPYIDKDGHIIKVERG